MTEIQNPKYDLEERTYKFGADCRKESKESILWLRLLDIEEKELDKERTRLKQEATELMKIFGSILRKSE